MTTSCPGLVLAAVVLLVVVVLVATSVAAGAVVESVDVLVMLHGRVVLLVARVAAKSFLCHVRLHRLRRVGSQVVGKVSRVRMVLCHGLCRCFLGLCPAVGRSLVG